MCVTTLGCNAFLSCDLFDVSHKSCSSLPAPLILKVLKGSDLYLLSLGFALFITLLPLGFAFGFVTQFYQKDGENEYLLMSHIY